MQLRESGYRRWLAGLPPGQVVGRAQDCFACPLAGYLRAQGEVYAEVRPSFYSWDDFESRRLPVWARRHVRAVDALPMWSRITAGEALAMLNGGGA